MQNGKNYHKHSDSKPQTQLAIEKFADMMIARMEEMKESHWKKGWIDGTGGYGLPHDTLSTVPIIMCRQTGNLWFILIQKVGKRKEEVTL